MRRGFPALGSVYPRRFAARKTALGSVYPRRFAARRTSAARWQRPVALRAGADAPAAEQVATLPQALLYAPKDGRRSVSVVVFLHDPSAPVKAMPLRGAIRSAAALRLAALTDAL